MNAWDAWEDAHNAVRSPVLLIPKGALGSLRLVDIRPGRTISMRPGAMKIMRMIAPRLGELVAAALAEQESWR